MADAVCVDCVTLLVIKPGEYQRDNGEWAPILSVPSALRLRETYGVPIRTDLRQTLEIEAVATIDGTTVCALHLAQRVEGRINRG